MIQLYADRRLLLQYDVNETKLLQNMHNSLNKYIKYNNTFSRSQFFNTTYRLVKTMYIIDFFAHNIEYGSESSVKRAAANTRRINISDGVPF